MAKLRSEDIADLSGLIQQIDDALKLTLELKDVLTKDIKQATEALKGIKITDSESFKKVNDGIDTLKQKTLQLNTVNAKRKALAQEQYNLTKKNVKTKAQLIKANSKLAKENAILAEKRKLANKQAREQAKNALGLVSAYQRESKKLNDLRKAYKDLAVQGKQNTKEAKDFLRQINQLDKKLKSVDASVGQYQRNVGNYASGFQKVGNQIRGLVGGFTAVSVLRDSIDIVKDFDQSMQNLKAISGATEEEFARLEKQARDLGSSTQYTASEVGGLQTELAKLGFNTSEITQSTGAILDFATATGADLPQSAALAGSALRAFGLDASEMERVVSTLGVATTKSALDFEQLNAGLSTVAPVAASFGFSIEDTTALLGQLANAGFDASSSATATRNILLNLADANGNLAKELGRPIKNADDLAAGLQELQAKGIDLATALELTDKRSVAAFSTFIEGADNLVGLRDSITGANDELQNMADIQRDSLQGAFDRLNSAWEGFILDTAEAGGALFSLKDIIGFVADNLNEIINVVLVATSAFLSFKASIAIQKLLTNLTQTLTGVGGTISMLSKSFKAGTLSVKGFSTAVKSIPFAGIISGITTIISSIALFSDETDEAASQQEALNAAMQTGIDNANSYADALESSIAKLKESIKQQISLAKAQGASEDDLAKMRTESAEELKQKTIDAYESIKTKQDELANSSVKIIELEDEIGRKREKVNDLLNQQAIDNSYMDEQKRENIEREQAELKKIILERDSLNQKIGMELGLRGLVHSTAKVQTAIENELVTLNERKLEFSGKIKDAEIEVLETKNAQNDADKKAIAEAKKKAQEYQRYLDSLRKRLEDLRDQSITDDEERDIAVLERKFARELAGIKGNSKLEQDLKIALENELSKQIEQIQKRYRDKRLSEEYDAEVEIQNQILQEKLNANKLEFADDNRLKIENLKAEKTHLQELILINQKAGKRSIELEQQLALKSTEILNATIERNKALIEKNFGQEIDVQDQTEQDRELKALKTIQDEDELNDKLLDNEIKALQERIEIGKQYGKKTTDLEIELQRKLREKDQRAKEKQIEADKQFYQTLQQVADAYAQYMRNKDQQQLQRIDEQIDAVKKRQDVFRALAESGDLDAQKSITAEIKREERLQKEKERIQKAAARRELFLTGVKTYAAKIESGSQNPLIDTLKDLALLSAGVAGLSTFIEGTEGDKTLGEMLGKPHLNTFKDQYIIRADAAERIFNPAQSNAISGYTNDEVAKIIQDHKNGMSVTPFDMVGVDKMYTFEPNQTSNTYMRTVSIQLNQQEKYLRQIAEKPVYLGGDFNEATKAFDAYVQYKNKIEKLSTKVSDIDW